jgi:phosphohistidine phosphatase
MTFEIYLVRHGLAGQFGDYEDDSMRPLTEEGLKKTRRVAARLKDFGIQFDLIYTSPYQRAYQTAQILQSEGIGKTIQVCDTLTPDGDTAVTIDRLTQLRTAAMKVAIVGHEPHLSQLATKLILGQESGNLILKKAGVMGLTAPIEGDLMGHCELFWLVPPRLLLP